MSTVHRINLVLLIALLLVSVLGYSHVPAVLPRDIQHRYDFGLPSIHYWFRPTIYLLAFAGILCLMGAVYNKAQDDRAEGFFWGTTLILFIGSMSRLAELLWFQRQDKIGNFVLIAALIVVIVGAILLKRGYGDSWD